jgi:hypothetical protein
VLPCKEVHQNEITSPSPRENARSMFDKEEKIDNRTGGDNFQLEMTLWLLSTETTIAATVPKKCYYLCFGRSRCTYKKQSRAMQKCLGLESGSRIQDAMDFALGIFRVEWQSLDAPEYRYVKRIIDVKV